MENKQQVQIATVSAKELSLVENNLLNQPQLAFITAKTPK